MKLLSLNTDHTIKNAGGEVQAVDYMPSTEFKLILLGEKKVTSATSKPSTKRVCK